MEYKEAVLWGVILKMAQQGDESAIMNIESENRWRKENNLPPVEEEAKKTYFEYLNKKNGAKEGG